jgi:uncharacterized protein YoxC
MDFYFDWKLAIVSSLYYIIILSIIVAAITFVHYKIIYKKIIKVKLEQIEKRLEQIEKQIEGKRDTNFADEPLLSRNDTTQ